MKRLSVLLVVVSVVVACQSNSSSGLEQKVEELEIKVAELEHLKPGLGQIMNLILLHHKKLEVSIQEKNTELYQYFVHEIEEDIEMVVENHGQHDGVDLAGLAKTTILPAIEEMEDLDPAKDSVLVLESFEYLTVSCNKCHASSGHEYIRISSKGEGKVFNQVF